MRNFYMDARYPKVDLVFITNQSQDYPSVVGAVVVAVTKSTFRSSVPAPDLIKVQGTMTPRCQLQHNLQMYEADLMRHVPDVIT